MLLSAPTPRHLAAAAHQLLTWLDAAGAAADLPALARALRAGRSAQPCRTALVVSDLAGLKERLRALAHGEKGADLREGAATRWGSAHCRRPPPTSPRSGAAATSGS
ncbi:hypothetical protein ACFQVA_40560 [Actinomadura keratinilytica]